MFGPESFVTRTPYLAAPDEYFVLDRLHLTYVDMGFHLSLLVLAAPILCHGV